MDFILDNLEAAGVIGGYVAISIIGFALITYATRKRHSLANQIGPRSIHPIIGSLLGAVPGCGATIVVSSLYKNRKISFGGLFATFISTLGEGSFVLLGVSDEADVLGNLEAYFVVTVFGVVAGTAFGYLADAVGLRINGENIPEQPKADHPSLAKQNSLPGFFIEKVGFYAIIAMAIFLAPGSIMAFWNKGIADFSESATWVSFANASTYWVSVTLTLTCILYYLVDRAIYKHHQCHCNENDVKSTLLHAILDVAEVVTFVFIGLVVANYVIDELVGAETFDAWMKSRPFVVVLLAALIGATPGCGGMIAVAVAFIDIPDFPLAALIAAAIATSGDGIFPLLAENKKDGLIVSGAGLVVALFVGYVALVLGF